MAKYNLDRFLDGQSAGYDNALNEIRSGRKEGHWIWYVFPQMKGLGRSRDSQFYGISGKEEARAYLEHHVLGTRLREISKALLAIKGKTSNEIFSTIDAMKVRSCMTLFDAISPEDIFAAVIDKYYKGRRDAVSLKLIDADSSSGFRPININDEWIRFVDYTFAGKDDHLTRALKRATMIKEMGEECLIMHIFSPVTDSAEKNALRRADVLDGDLERDFARFIHMDVEFN